MISVSIVSHQQVAMLDLLLEDLRCCASDIEVIITHNVVEHPCAVCNEFRHVIINNNSPKGFGANHNAAFKVSSGKFFCVLNPDIRLTVNIFPRLIELARDSGVGVVAPAIIAPGGFLEDSARRFPSPIELLCKALGGKSAVHNGGESVFEPDWIAGMFMLFPRKVFEEMGGFDERYFLYYEDVDLCARLALAGYKRLVCQDVSVVHDARRSSHSNPRYAVMHARSIIRFFSSDVYRKVRLIQRDQRRP